jgi:choline-phosphate cytidylyltransferase
VYSDGIFDLFHFGHAQALEQAKKSFPNVTLIVGVCNDEITNKYKGKTVMTDKERYTSVKHCKWVDEVIEDAPWFVDQAFLDLHQIDYVAHDALPYTSADSDDVYQFVKEQGRFIATKRTEGVSTSDLITRIVRDYDLYVKRNIQRGVSAKELNVSFFKANEIKIKHKVGVITQKIADKVVNEYTDAKNELPDNWRNYITTIEENSSELIRGFIGLFGKDSPFFRSKRRKTESSSEEGNSSHEEAKARSPLSYFFPSE